MKKFNSSCCILLVFCCILLAGCNSGATNNSTQNNILNKISQAFSTDNSVLVLSDVNSAIDYRDSLEDIPVNTFGLKRILVTNNNDQKIHGLKFPSDFPKEITYDDTRTTCDLSGIQQLAAQESCLIVFKYLPKIEGESSSFNITINAIDDNQNLITSNSKNIPYSSRITQSPQIKFTTKQITTIGGMSESIVLNYTGPMITKPITVSILTSNSALNLSTESCTFDKTNNVCNIQAKVERNKSGSFTIYTNSTSLPEASLLVVAKPLNCNLINDVQTTPYKLPLGFELQRNECIMVADNENNFVSILKFNNDFIPEFNIIPCDIKNDTECEQSIWVPLQGVGFDEYLSNKNQNALDLCLAQPYYEPGMIGIPGQPTLRFGILTHGPNKGKASLSERSIAYLGAELVLWDSLTYAGNSTTNNTLYISTDDEYRNSFYMLADDMKTKLWNIRYSTFKFSEEDLRTGKDLCQFYKQWQ